MGAFLSIIRTGVSESDGYQERRGIILSNSIALILLAALVAVNLSWLFFFGTTSISYTIVGFILFLSPIICNRFHFTKLSRLIVCFAPVFFIWYVFLSRMVEMETIGPSVYSGFRIYLVAVCFVPYLLFSKEETYLLVLGSLPTFLAIVFFNTILTMLDLGPEKLGLISPDFDLQPIRTVIAYGIISAGCYTFHFIIDQNDAMNEKLLTELKLQASEIKSQNEKLVQSESNLSNLNHHLEALVEKKIENIKKQNALLLKYAYANAHYVRGPVARILGLFQLKKIDPDLTYPWFFEKVEYETNQIDKILKRISDELHEAQREHE
jgi:signal transduction histidine kinase